MRFLNLEKYSLFTESKYIHEIRGLKRAGERLPQLENTSELKLSIKSTKLEGTSVEEIRL
ncbi:MAG: hypothetical protein DRJ38_07550 [Thermoprotei archaeon]|nr:MAG: hypothetical protein DRJ38_07550 [Thermoprotei archaeon]